jgi:hypothetical protein
MSHTTLEVFSLDLNGWIELSLNEFSNLMVPFKNFYGENQEIALNSIGLKYKLETTREKLTLDQIKEGDYYEVKRKSKLSVKMSNWYNGGLKLNVLSSEIATYIEEWQDSNTTNKIISNNFTVYTRCRVILKNEEANEVIVSLLDDNNFNAHNKLEKVSVHDLRFLNDGTYENSISASGDKPLITNIIDSNSLLTLKKLSAEYLIRKFKIHGEEYFNTIHQSIFHKFDLAKLFHEIQFDSENIKMFYDFSEDKRNEIILVSSNLNIVFITHMLSIKLKRFIESEKILKEIQREKEKIDSLKKIIETREKKIYKFSLKFMESIKNKILDNLNKDDFSYVINILDDYFELIIYEKGKKGNLKKIEKDFNLKEDSIRVDSKLADWIKSNESKEELDKILKTSKIVFNLDIYFFHIS